jgi:uncharacterized protein (TIGR00725 family)
VGLVAVIGKGVECPDAAAFAAYNAGRAVARRGHLLVTGALGGCMEGASAGAASLGGKVVGLVPLGRQPNEHVNIPIRLGLPEPFRNVVLAHAVDAALVCEGGHGTAQELSFLRERGVPLAQVDTAMWGSDIEPLRGRVEDACFEWLGRVLLR